MIDNKKLLNSFATITLGELIKPIKKKIIWIETEHNLYHPDYYHIGSKELTLFGDSLQLNIDEQWELDTEVKILKKRSVVKIEETQLSFMVGSLHKF
jgi:hypothetical protein